MPHAADICGAWVVNTEQSTNELMSDPSQLIAPPEAHDADYTATNEAPGRPGSLHVPPAYLVDADKKGWPCIEDQSPCLVGLEGLRYQETYDHVPSLAIPEPLYPMSNSSLHQDDDDEDPYGNGDCISVELERRWILNLSMRFRDKSNREKFFVTFAQTPNLWRRLTISLTYTDAPAGSLEDDLSNIPYQREKSRRIYEAIRESLADIEYCDTVTNLKLETLADDGQLHVHVREDSNEAIEYPPVSWFEHTSCRKYRESEVHFVSHLSGFVYKVEVHGHTLVKKEIAGPDAVDEFLYEVNALSDLTGSDHVIQLQGLITDHTGALVKGLLIEYASRGTLADLLYDYAGTPALRWARKQKWARQIVQGLSNIHEAGYVQGDFTLSNIVVDRRDNAAIIDINRRGCPMGWEPPELGRLIDSGQRISLHISTKTDLYQLGMVLWALATGSDEPERVERPLSIEQNDVPNYFRHLVHTCLAERPQHRRSAKELLSMFPAADSEGPSHNKLMSQHIDAFEQTDHHVARSSDSLTPAYVQVDARRGRSTSSRHRARSVSTYSTPPITRPPSPIASQTSILAREMEKSATMARFVHVDSGFDEAFIDDLAHT